MMQENLITLKAYYGKQQGPLSLNPVKDLSTNKLLGVKQLSPQDKLTAAKVVDADTSRRLTDGVTFDLDDEIDAIDWAWVQHNKEISANEEEAHDNPQCLFYIDQPDLAIDKSLEKFDLAYEATKLVKESSPEERRDICRYLGQNFDSFRDKDVLEYLAGRVKSDPKSLIKAKEDPNYKDKLFLQQLLNARLFKKDINGTIKYGDIIVALNNEAAILWINSPKNRALVGKLYGKLFGDEGEEVTGSIVEEFESLKGDKKNKEAGTSGAAGKASAKSTEVKTPVGLEAEEEVL